MKTAFLFNEFDYGVSFFILDGDYTHLDGVYVNSVDCEEDASSELTNLMYDPVDGHMLHRKATKDEFVQAIQNGAAMIVCGFIP
jgi:hypothetical protein